MQQKNTEKKVCHLNPDSIDTLVTKGERHSTLSCRVSLIGKATGWWPKRKIRIGFFLLLSVVFHISLMEGIYLLSRNQAQNKIKEKVSPLVFKIEPPEEVSPKKQPVAPAPDRKPETHPKAARTKLEKPSIKSLPARQLEAIGEEHMQMVKEGSFPPLVLDYPDPSVFVRQMYSLDAKTVAYDTVRREYYAMDLITGELLPMGSNDFKMFSPIKRVIRDSEFDSQKEQAAGRLGSSVEALQIILLLPLAVEQRWIGHQVSVFEQMKLDVSDIVTVEARFHGSRLKLVRVHLKDGSLKEIQDPGTA